jgi:hypothetical protein
MAEMINRPIGNSGLVVGVPTHVKDQYLRNYQVRHFEVVKIPDSLVLPQNKRQFVEMGYQPPYEEEMDLKPKDIVWANLQAAHQAIKVNFKDKEQDYYLVHYSQIYVVRRRCFHVNWDDKVDNRVKFDDVVLDVIPLHGFVVCEKLFEKHKYLDKQVEVQGKLKVKWTGKCPPFIYNINNGQLGKDEYHHLNVKAGDRIQADGPYIGLESELFQEFTGHKNLIVIERRFITGIL